MLLRYLSKLHKLKVKEKSLEHILRNDWLSFTKAFAKLLIP